jgi:hypothetical protein
MFKLTGHTAQHATDHVIAQPYFHVPGIRHTYRYLIRVGAFRVSLCADRGASVHTVLPSFKVAASTVIGDSSVGPTLHAAAACACS